MESQIKVTVVESKADLKRFIDLPHSLYRDNPYWVPSLRRSEFETLDPAKNPAFDHCDAKLFLCHRDRKVVGRIAAIINHLENHEKEKKLARFGWIDFVDDERISQALFSAAESWAITQGCHAIKGPLGFSNMDKAGLLIEGFDELATMAVIYNHPYYPKHIEKLGYLKLVDWKEFEATVPDEIPERVTKFANMIAKRYQLREYDPKTDKPMKVVGRELFELINVAYRDLEGFIPHSDKQIDLFVQQYLTMINPDFLSIIYDGHDQLAGFGISMPSFSKALRRAKGRLFPFGFLHLRRAMRKNDRVDLYLIAVRPDMQSKGVTAMIFHKLIKSMIAYGIKKAETNPEQEANQDVQNLWKGYEMRLHKRRRCYIKELA